MLRKFQVLFFLLAIAMISDSCSSKGNDGGGGGGGGGGNTEANLLVSLNPPAGSTQPAAPQTDFPLTVSIASAMPSQGVTIDVKAAPEGTTNNFFSQLISSTSANNNFTITNTPTGVICVTTVTVTSKTKATNTVTLTYRYSRKP